jgi:hypothetical protein
LSIKSAIDENAAGNILLFAGAVGGVEAVEAVDTADTASEADCALHRTNRRVQ